MGQAILPWVLYFSHRLSLNADEPRRMRLIISTDSCKVISLFFYRAKRVRKKLACTVKTVESHFEKKKREYFKINFGLSDELLSYLSWQNSVI